MVDSFPVQTLRNSITLFPFRTQSPHFLAKVPRGLACVLVRGQGVRNKSQMPPSLPTPHGLDWIAALPHSDRRRG